MAENPAGNGKAKADAERDRDVAYYEKLRRDLRDNLAKKKALDAELAELDADIRRRETAYLENYGAGNIVKGFDNYIKGTSLATSSGGGGPMARRKAAISDADRIFSNGSISFARDASTAGSATPSLATTPTSAFPTRESSQSAQQTASRTMNGNKKKKTADEEEADGKSKRAKITYGTPGARD
ncbi:NuA4-domain-containing protein [Sporormia fimetaria CBS 119925]|uniref:Chromatin modification-related protein EAF6 n=1 Tax=Sporormia fimetaria CBS 119925 TaxID=1340428 RepID=A0A6A6VJC0_9PLEO|nr:NuA4-domain-containing protein [Sporormia fimetaria CBS 119925]